MPNSKRLSAEQIRQWAREGAAKALQELKADIIAIERTFPELKLPTGRRAVRQTVASARTQARTMSDEARKEVSRRMKKYWAERRKAKSKVSR